MPDTGFEVQPWLVRRGGTFVQVSELMYELLQRCDGRSSVEQIATSLTRSSQWSVEPDHVRYLIREKLAPLGLVVDGGSISVTASDDADEEDEAPLQRSRRATLWAINLRRPLLSERGISAVGGALRFLFLPPIVVMLLALALLAQGWVFFEHGVDASAADLVNRPAAFLVLIGVALLAAVFHEFGHAAGLSFGGGRPRGMGFGFYLIFPAFYTDVTDAYRLSRRARVRTDLGGPYFHLVFSLFAIGAYLATRQEYLLLLVLLVDIEVIRQFIPFLRLDGYWLLADLAGVPDFLSQAAPFLRRASAGRLSGEKLPSVRRSVKVTFAAFLVVTFLVLPTLLVVGLVKLPHVVELAWLGLLRQGDQFQQAWQAGHVLGSVAVLVAILLLLLQMAGIGVFLYLLTVRLIGRAWAWTAGRPASARWLVRGSLAMGVGGFLVVVGSLYPWRSVGPLGGGDRTGFSLGAGRIALACGAVLVALSLLVLVMRTQGGRRAIALTALALGLAGTAFAARDVVRARGAVDDAIRQSIRRSTGHEATQSQIRDVRAVAASLGIAVSPRFGAPVTGGGGVIAAAGGVAVLAMARPRRIRQAGSGP